MSHRNGNGVIAPQRARTAVLDPEPGHFVMACSTVQVKTGDAAAWVSLIASPNGLLRSTMPAPTEDDATTALLPHITAAQRRPLGPPGNLSDDESWVEGLLEDAARRLRAYFQGEREPFDLPVDWSRLPSFTIAVLQEVRRIPYGEVRTYGDIARLLDRPRASRAVGQALGANPVPVIVPCHRVVGATGLGGFGGGLEMKRRLLAQEGVRVE